MYYFDSNATLAEPIKSIKTKHLIEGFTSCHKRITASGITPILLRLDNKIFSDLIDTIHSKNLKYQLANTYDHHHKLAERAIQTFKAHFTSIMNGRDACFPPHLWCRLIPQAEQTLNFLRRSRINPKLSAYNQIYGLFDFNSTPLAPLGTKFIVYEKNPNTFPLGLTTVNTVGTLALLQLTTKITKSTSIPLRRLDTVTPLYY